MLQDNGVNRLSLGLGVSPVLGQVAARHLRAVIVIGNDLACIQLELALWVLQARSWTPQEIGALPMVVLHC